MKKRIMVALALAMIVASLAVGTAQAARRPLTLGASAHPDPAKVGEPVHFVFTETNNQPFSLEDVGVRVELPNQNWFVSAHSSQGECTYVRSFFTISWLLLVPARNDSVVPISVEVIRLHIDCR